MINSIEANINQICIHKIGNILNEEPLVVAQQPIDIYDGGLKQVLLRYFLKNFKQPIFSNFNIGDQYESQNVIYNIAQEIFAEPDKIFNASQQIAHHLYTSSDHQAIRSGHLLVSYIEDVLIEDEMLSAIVIYKAELTDEFLKIEDTSDSFNLITDDGFLVGRTDKACIIFNTEKESGYKICVLDNTNKEKTAQFWKEKFLNLVNREDNFHKTKDVIDATKAFVSDHLKQVYDLDKTEEAGILNKCKKYFEKSASFNQEEFSETIFDNQDTKQEFQNFSNQYQQENNLKLADNFDVSELAVKKQSKVFKSILKLDKNFHIYIHGNRDLIKRGKDENGKKFYKIFYEEEH